MLKNSYKLFLVPLLVFPLNSGDTLSKSGFVSFVSNQTSQTASDFFPSTITFENQVPASNDSSIIIQKHNHEANSIKYISTAINTSTESFGIAGKRVNDEITYINDFKGKVRYSASSENNLSPIPNIYETKQPITTIGKLTGTLDSKTFQGSCFILPNGYIMTAAHCVYIDGNYIRNLYVNFEYIKGGKFKIVESYLPKAWVDSNPTFNTSYPTTEQKNNDWAILKIANTTQLSVYGSTTIFTNSDFSGDEYIAIGYPQGGNLKYSKGYGTISQTEYRYDLNTYVTGGMSGGPLIAYFTEWDERIQETLRYIGVIGIISTSEPDYPSNNSWTGVTRITNTMLTFIDRFGQ